MKQIEEINQSMSSISNHDQSLFKEHSYLKFCDEVSGCSEEGLSFRSINQNAPLDIRDKFQWCLPLIGYNFFQMFTCAIFQHFARLKRQVKKQKLFKLKKDIESMTFLQNNQQTKTSLLRGLHIVQNCTNSNTLIIEELKKRKLLTVFSDIWKELISFKKCKKFDRIEFLKELGNYFKLPLTVYVKIFQIYQQVNLIPEEIKEYSHNLPTITLIILEENFDDSGEFIIKELSKESTLNQKGYLLLYADRNIPSKKQQQMPPIFEQYLSSNEIILIQQKQFTGKYSKQIQDARKNKERANRLSEKMNNFLIEIRSLK